MIPMSIDEVAAAAGGAWAGPSAGGWMIRSISTDSRTCGAGDLFVAIRGERDDGHRYVAGALARGASACLVSREWLASQSPVTHARCIAVDCPLQALGRLASHHRRCVMSRSTVVIAVTGSNGKTTTKNMIHHVLAGERRGSAAAASFNNALGVPLTLLGVSAGDEYVVVEIGTNAPGEIAALAALAAPDIAVITSIGHAHVGGLGSISDIAREKGSILRFVGSGGAERDGCPRQGRFAVVPSESVELRGEVPSDYEPAGGARVGAGVDVGGDAGSGVEAKAASPVENRCHSQTQTPVENRCHTEAPRLMCGVGSGGCDDVRVGVIDADETGTDILFDDCVFARLNLPGVHFANLAGMVYAVGLRMGLSADAIVERLRTFQAAEHRMSVTRRYGLLLIDDCYNANPSSMRAALDVLAIARGCRRVFVMGDMLELGAAAEAYHTEIGAYAAKRGVDVLLSVGRLAGVAASAAGRAGVTRVKSFDTSDAAARHLLQLAARGDAILIKGSRAMRLETVVSAVLGSGGAAGDGQDARFDERPWADDGDAPHQLTGTAEGDGVGM